MQRSRAPNRLLLLSPHACLLWFPVRRFSLSFPFCGESATHGDLSSKASSLGCDQDGEPGGKLAGLEGKRLVFFNTSGGERDGRAAARVRGWEGVLLAWLCSLPPEVSHPG